MGMLNGSFVPLLPAYAACNKMSFPRLCWTEKFQFCMYGVSWPALTELIDWPRLVLAFNWAREAAGLMPPGNGFERFTIGVAPSSEVMMLVLPVKPSVKPALGPAAPTGDKP